jgi:adenylate cyclase
VAASGAQRSRPKPTSDLAAYDCFLQGREIIERRGDPEAAAQLFCRAIELDPDFAQAYAWLGRINILKFHFELLPARLDEAIKLAQHALFLDEADAWSHAVLGHAYMVGGQHDLAGLHLDRAMALNSTDIRITSQRAMWLAYTGRGDEAVQSLDADLDRDPFPPGMDLGLSRSGLVRGPQIRRGDPSNQSSANHLRLGLLYSCRCLCPSWSD